MVAYFQPEVELATGRLVAVESLARWIAALVILIVAAGTQLRARPTAEFAPPPQASAGRPSALPYFAVAGSYLLLTIVGLRDFRFNPLGGR